MQPLKNLDEYGKQILPKLSAFERRKKTTETLTKLWFSWPSMAHVNTRNIPSSRFLKFREWSGYGANRDFDIPQKLCTGRCLNEWAVIIGQSFIGKTRLGKHLRKTFDLRVYDTDAIIEHRLKYSISKSFSKWGESVFREMEARVLMDIVEHPKGLIILGGGSLQGPVLGELLKSIKYRIFLDVDWQVIWRRLVQSRSYRNDFKRDFRVLLSGEEDFFRSIWDSRQRLFEKWATSKLICGTGDISQIAGKIYKLFLKNRLLTF